MVVFTSEFLDNIDECSLDTIMYLAIQDATRHKRVKAFFGLSNVWFNKKVKSSNHQSAYLMTCFCRRLLWYFKI